MNTYTFESYLTEYRLKDFLEFYFGKENVISQWKIPNTRFRYDFLINNQIVVEFDADSHYRDSIVIWRDNQKDNLIKNKYKLIRIPYFVQLTNQTFEYYFNECSKINIIQKFPHGWIVSNIFPASFCQLGIERCEKELQALPLNILQDIIFSLKEKSKKFNFETVFYYSNWIDETINLYSVFDNKKGS